MKKKERKEKKSLGQQRKSLPLGLTVWRGGCGVTQSEAYGKLSRDDSGIVITSPIRLQNNKVEKELLERRTKRKEKHEKVN